MSRLEIIHLRSAGERLDSLSARITESIPAGSESVTLYRREGLDTDLVLLLVPGDEPGREGPSDLGLQLASALKAFGLVEHTLWKEIR